MSLNISLCYSRGQPKMLYGNDWQRHRGLYTSTARPVSVHPRPFMRHAVGSVRMNSPPLRFILLSARPLQTIDMFSPLVDIINWPGDNPCTELASMWAPVIVIRYYLRNFFSPALLSQCLSHHIPATCAIMRHLL